MAREYSLLTQSPTFDSYSRDWSGNILGANAWGTSLIVGDGQVFPNCMQHQVANLAGSLNGTPPVLAGAAVEGPNADASTGELDGMRACPAQRTRCVHSIEWYCCVQGFRAVICDPRTSNRPYGVIATRFCLANGRWTRRNSIERFRSREHI